MFRITSHKGFQIEFENGYRVSVQFGPHNYCDHYHTENLDAAAPKMVDWWESTTAETALISQAGRFIKYDGYDVQGNRTPAQVAELIAYAAALPKWGETPK